MWGLRRPGVLVDKTIRTCWGVRGPQPKAWCCLDHPELLLLRLLHAHLLVWWLGNWIGEGNWIRRFVIVVYRDGYLLSLNLAEWWENGHVFSLTWDHWNVWNTAFDEIFCKKAVHFFLAFPSFIQRGAPRRARIGPDWLLVEHATTHFRLLLVKLSWTGGPLLERLLRPITGEGPAQIFRLSPPSSTYIQAQSF